MAETKVEQTITTRIRLVERTVGGKTTYQAETEDMLARSISAYIGGPTAWVAVGPEFEAEDRAAAVAFFDETVAGAFASSDVVMERELRIPVELVAKVTGAKT